MCSLMPALNLLQMHYMFGGNPGDSSGKSQQNMRLDDFWKLKVSDTGQEMR